MRNVLTAGENSPRVVDHFPASRASRWKQNQNAGPNNGGNVYDMMQLDIDGGLDGPTMTLQRN